MDPIFYSREGLSGAYTVPYIHATALNHAVSFSLTINPESQPYIISDSNGGRDIPRYINSISSNDFYFTPARLKGNLNYYGELVKGDGDGYIQLGYGASTGKKEMLKASKIFSISPESKFEGYLIVYKENISMPPLIRLGSFRGKAELTLGKGPLKIGKKDIANYVSHLVDPLVTNVKRGRLINMLPYPIVENAYYEKCVEVYEGGFKKFIALPEYIPIDGDEPIVKSKSTVIF